MSAGNNSKIADNIKKYRNKLGISQDVLSKKANLAFHTIAKIEDGSTPNPTIDTVKKNSRRTRRFACLPAFGGMI